MTTQSKPTLIAVADGASPLDVLAERHRVAWTRTQHGRQEWIEGTLELATVLAEERKLIPADQEFSRWLKRNDLAEIKHEDRAALIGMATDLDVTRKVLEQTDNTSWRYIWQTKLRERFSRTAKPQQRRKQQKPAAPNPDSAWPPARVAEVARMWTQGLTMEQIGDELSTLKHPVTRSQIASVIRRFNLQREQSTTPAPPLSEKTIFDVRLTPEQVDPDFKGTPLEFSTKYGHVNLQTKAQIETNRRQEVLAAWQGAISDHAATTKALLNAAPPDLDTLREWAGKPGKMDKLRLWLEAIEAAHHSLDLYVQFVRDRSPPCQ